MTIPQSVLENWTNYETAAIDSARETHNRVRELLESSSELSSVDFETFLQGSYANTTLVRGRGDVDIVVKLDQTWQSDLSRLDTGEKELYTDNTSSPSYQWPEFRSDVINVLKSQYGSDAIVEGDKAIELDASSLSLGADIVVCLQYRRYESLTSYPGEYTEGIVFWTQEENEKIVNYPKQHRENGADKHEETNERYKPTVRMFKNARNSMDEKGILTKDRAPSYFVECLLYNVPSGEYKNDLTERYLSILEYLEENPIGEFQCQNELLPLFGPDSTQWSVDEANSFITGLRSLYEDW